MGGLNNRFPPLFFVCSMTLHQLCTLYKVYYGICYVQRSMGTLFSPSALISPVNHNSTTASKSDGSGFGHLMLLIAAAITGSAVIATAHTDMYTCHVRSAEGIINATCQHPFSSNYL
jgi:hypothetical protein